MSETLAPSNEDYLDLAYWAYSQVGTDYVDGPTALPFGYSFLTSDGAPLIDYNPCTGFYGAALVSTTGQIAITFEGTNLGTANHIFTFAQILDDFDIVYGKVAPAFTSAYDFTEQVIQDVEQEDGSTAASDIFLTGHSLGGAEAEYVAQQTGLPGTTFGAPGIATDNTGHSGANFFDYVDRGDPVGNYAPDGNETPVLQTQNIAHYGQALYVGPYTNASYLIAASIAYLAAESTSSPYVATAEYGAAALSLATAASYYHPLANYAKDLCLPAPPGPSANGLQSTEGSGGADLSAGTVPFPDGTIDIPGFNIDSPGAIQVSGGTVTLFYDGESDSLAVPASADTISLTSDGAGGTLITSSAASSGYVFAGSNGATVQGGADSLYFLGGSGSVSVTGGSGDTTLFGGSGTAVLQGGSGTNLLYGGAGAATLIAGTGASTLIGGSGTTQEFAEGSAPVVLIGGSGATSVNGTTGTGSETVFTGGGQSFIALDGAADTVVGGSGAASVIGGSGSDVYGFIDNHAGGSEIIFGLKNTDVIAFGGYAGDPITSEGVVQGSDLLTLADGTIILLQGIDHKVFNGLA
jgi:Ca2+-binding RTX toxin-like protein